MSTESAPRFDPVNYKETIREQWHPAAEPGFRWASQARDVAPGWVWNAGRLRSREWGGTLWEGAGGDNKNKLTGRRLERVVDNPTVA
jgi:hypothetical protein